MWRSVAELLKSTHSRNSQRRTRSTKRTPASGFGTTLGGYRFEWICSVLGLFYLGPPQAGLPQSPILDNDAIGGVVRVLSVA
jgi:hypothetical protein